MQLPDVSALGWIHSALCTVALIAGAVQLARPKLREYALLYWFQYANNAAAFIALTMSIVAVRRFRSRAGGLVYA